MADGIQDTTMMAPVTTPRASFLDSNPFKEKQRQAVMDAVGTIISVSNAPRKIGMVGDMPVIQAGYIGTILTPISSKARESKALLRGEYFLVTRSGGTNEVQALADSLDLGAEGLKKIQKGGYDPQDFPALEKFLSEWREAGVPIDAIYVSRPLDCLQFVNSSLAASGARRLSPGSGSDLLSALMRPGMAAIETTDNLAPKDSSGVRAVDAPRVSEFVRSAKAGDVILFLRGAEGVKNLKDAQEWEKKNSDRIIWLDEKNRVVDTAGMPGKAVPGKPYNVGHTSIYAGIEPETQQPMVAQLHIHSGSIAMENLGKYLHSQRNFFEAVAIMSYDFFENAGKAILLASK